MTDTTMNTGAASLSDERERAAITACALMIKGICLTRPNAEWTGAIEDRIQFMLKQMQAGAAIAAGGAQEPAEQDERGATIQEGWILVKKERIEAIRAATNVNLEESYRGRGLYEERTLIRNSHELETAIDAIKDELREMTECDPDELAEARAASTSANVAQLQSVDLPPRVIDQLYQAAGVSTYHPDGDQQEKLHAFARNVVAETLARLPTANVAQGAEAQSGEPVAMDDDELAEFRQTAEDFEDNGETSTPYDILMNWAERGFLDCTHFELTAEGRALLGEPVEVVHFASPKNLADPAKD